MLEMSSGHLVNSDFFMWKCDKCISNAICLAMYYATVDSLLQSIVCLTFAHAYTDNHRAYIIAKQTCQPQCLYN